MDSKIKIEGYHGTTSSYKESITKEGLDPEKTNERENHWLGDGVYFFEKYKMAKWWGDIIASNASKKTEDVYSIVCKTQIEVFKENVLDLDISEDLDKFGDFSLELDKKFKEKKHLNFKSQRQMRGVYFNYYKMKNNIFVIMNTFEKEKTTYAKYRDKKDLSDQITLFKALGLSYKEKQICVSNKECIKDIQVIDENKIEVI